MVPGGCVEGWHAAGRRFFPTQRLTKDQASRLRGWRKGSSLPMPPLKRIRRFDVTPLFLLRPLFARFVKRTLVELQHWGLIPLLRLEGYTNTIVQICVMKRVALFILVACAVLRFS